ncbi:hypothetical protein DPMN_128964 [Dreissena polymorpha]|uniref:Uncharacterized protein n=1 Tax=Dreissena polymorpha TaxID=45954 RepID=A0A9D4H4X2_DREPO|nr:hypothetical protein DPMN_128964 [Dreissena polymorpha]
MQRNDINSDDLRRRNMVDAWRLDAPVDAKDPLSITRSSGVMVRPLTFGSLPDLRSAERNEAQDDHEIRTQPVRHLVHLSVRLCPSLLSRYTYMHPQISFHSKWCSV